MAGIVNVRNKINVEGFKVEDFLKSTAETLYEPANDFLDNIKIGELSLGALSGLDLGEGLSAVTNAFGLQLTDVKEIVDKAFNKLVDAVTVNGMSPGRQHALRETLKDKCVELNADINTKFKIAGPQLETFPIMALGLSLACNGETNILTGLENAIGETLPDEIKVDLVKAVITDSTATTNGGKKMVGKTKISFLEDVAKSGVVEKVNNIVPDTEEAVMDFLRMDRLKSRNKHQIYVSLVRSITEILGRDLSNTEINRFKDNLFFQDVAECNLREEFHLYNLEDARLEAPSVSETFLNSCPYQALSPVTLPV